MKKCQSLPAFGGAGGDQGSKSKFQKKSKTQNPKQKLVLFFVLLSFRAFVINSCSCCILSAVLWFFPFFHPAHQSLGGGGYSSIPIFRAVHILISDFLGAATCPGEALAKTEAESEDGCPPWLGVARRAKTADLCLLNS
jgi:hypothetical protein